MEMGPRLLEHSQNGHPNQENLMMIGTEPGNFKNEKGVLDTLMLLGISRGTPNAPFDPFGE